MDFLVEKLKEKYRKERMGKEEKMDPLEKSMEKLKKAVAELVEAVKESRKINDKEKK